MNLDLLYPYQLKNAKTLAHLGFGLDGSFVGSGKTLSAFGVMELLQAKAILLVVPKSVSPQWEARFHEFCPDIEVYRPQGSGKDDRTEAIQGFLNSHADKKAIILTYEQWRISGAPLHNFRFDVCYLDEIHRAGNSMTKLYKELRKINADHRYGASATPMRSSPLQFYGIFNWLYPGCLGRNFWHFKAQYEVANQQGWHVGFKNLDHLAERIKPFYVKANPEEAKLSLPPLIEEDLVFPLGTKAQKLYEFMKRDMILEIEKIQINKIENPVNLYNSIVRLGKLQEVCDSMELVGDETESAKIEILKDSLKDNLIGDNKALLFTRFSRMANILARELGEYNPAIITGSTKDRKEQIDKFRLNPTCKVIIGTTALSEGVDGLQEAGNLIYMVDVPLGSYGMLTQIRGRLERHGQKKNMVMIYLMAEKTVDIKLKNLLLKKQEMSEKIFGSLAEIKDVLS